MNFEQNQDYIKVVVLVFVVLIIVDHKNLTLKFGQNWSNDIYCSCCFCCQIYLLYLLFLFCHCWCCWWWWCYWCSCFVLSQIPSIKSLVKIGLEIDEMLILLFLLLLFLLLLFFMLLLLLLLLIPQTYTFKVWLKLGQKHLGYWWHWVCLVGGWWSKVIFMSSPASKLSWGSVGFVTKM